MVGVQAVLGGLRVVDKSNEIAVVHGDCVSSVLATLVAVGAFCACTLHLEPAAGRAGAGAATDHLLSQALVAALAVQLVFGCWCGMRILKSSCMSPWRLLSCCWCWWLPCGRSRFTKVSPVLPIGNRPAGAGLHSGAGGD